MEENKKKDKVADKKISTKEFILDETKLFDSIVEKEHEIPREDLVNLTARLFEHSPEDGIRLTERLRLTSHELMVCLDREQFLQKHQNLAGEFINFYNIKSNFGKKKDIFLNSNLDILAETADRMNKFPDTKKELFITPEIKLKNKESKEILEKLDEHYAQYLLTKKIKENPNNGMGKWDRSNGEQIAEHVLKTAVDAGALYDSWDKNNKPKRGEINPKSRKAEMLKQLVNSVSDPRQLDILEQNQKNIAKKNLLTELEAILKPQGFEVVLNDKKYEVKEIEDKNKKPEKEENKGLIELTSEEYKIMSSILKYEIVPYINTSPRDSSFFKIRDNLKDDDRVVFGKAEDNINIYFEKDPYVVSQVLLQNLVHKEHQEEFFEHSLKFLIEKEVSKEDLFRLIRDNSLFSDLESGKNIRKTIDELVEKYQNPKEENKNSPEQIDPEIIKLARELKLMMESKGMLGTIDIVKLELLIDGKTDINIDELSGPQKQSLLDFASKFDKNLAKEFFNENKYSSKEYLLNSYINIGENINAKIILDEEYNKYLNNPQDSVIDIFALAQYYFKIGEKEKASKIFNVEKTDNASTVEHGILASMLGDAKNTEDVIKSLLHRTNDSDVINAIAKPLFENNNKRYFSSIIKELEEGNCFGSASFLLAIQGDNEAAESYLEKFRKSDKYNLKEDVKILIAMGDYEAVKSITESLIKNDQLTQAHEIIIELLVDIRSKNKQEINKDIAVGDEEEYKLKLLNLLENFDAEKANAFLEERKEWGDKDKNFMERSKNVASAIMRTIKSAPKAFLSTMGVKESKMDHLLVDRIMRRLVPEIFVEKEKKSNLDFGGKGSEGGFKKKESNYFGDTSQSSLDGGDPKEGNPELLMTFREPINGFIATNFYGNYNNNSKQWSKIEIPINQTILGETSETTVTIEKVNQNSPVILPNLIGARILNERTRGIIKDGKEIPLDTTLTSMNNGITIAKNGVEKIVYSLEKSEIQNPIPDITNKEFDNFKSRLEREISSDKFSSLLNENTSLDAELELFLQSIENKSLKEKVIAIESFVRDIGYYDFDNREVMEEKRGKSIEEKLYISKLRMDALRDNNKELAELTKNKIYAGVCADFTNITVELLRKAGIPAVASAGFMINGKEANSGNAHTTSFAIFPNPQGGNMLVRVEGTPGGINAEQQKELERLGLSTKSLSEKEIVAKKEIERITEQANKELEKILADLQTGDPAKIRELSNGKLESALNAILKNEVKNSHVNVISRVLDAYWYSPAKDLNIENIEEKVNLFKFLESEIKNARDASEKENKELGKPAGTYLFDLVRDFAKKFEKEGKVKNIEEAYNLIDQVAISLKEELNPTEQRAIFAIVTYLKAKKVLE